MTEFSAEFFGTFLLILLGTGVVANTILVGTKGNNGGWIVITTGWAFAVFAGVVVAGPYSGAHLNPAVTLALAIAGKFAWSKVGEYVFAQCAGAVLGATVTWLVYKDHFDATGDPALQLAVFSTSPAIGNRVFNLLSEIVGTFVLVFVIFYFTDPQIAGRKTPIGMGSLGALPVTLVVWAIGLSLGGTTGYAINPARDLGPRIVHTLIPMRNKGASGWGYAWVPVAGPLIGGAIAAMMYLWLKI
ncbi:MAG TPA: MIP/aquaporin family protein [Puia sp.]|nr:MIP/aquaporin family protein [Puia sp.]